MLSSLTLSERLAKLREENNLSPRSENQNEFPIKYLVFMYIESRKLIHTFSPHPASFITGLGLLADWLRNDYENQKSSSSLHLTNQWWKHNQEVSMISHALRCDTLEVITYIEEYYGKQDTRNG